MPIVWIVLLVAALWLWWPVYDLEVAHKPGPSEYQIVERDFYTLDGCREARSKWRHYDWSCMEKTGWGRMFNQHSTYNSRHR